MNTSFSFALTLGLLSLTASGCATGYTSAGALKSAGQDPSACAKSCDGLDMEMGALVLVSTALPACVCVPRGAMEKPEKPQVMGGAGSARAYIAIANAIAAQNEQNELRQGAVQKELRERAYPTH